MSSDDATAGEGIHPAYWRHRDVAGIIARGTRRDDPARDPLADHEAGPKGTLSLLT